jgi:hypothetical protein
MQQSCTYGSVRGAPGNRRPYRDNSVTNTSTKEWQPTNQDTASIS